MINELWSPEKTALLRELWPLGLTGHKMEEIMASKKMPTPSNAIYKKAYRLGLARRKNSADGVTKSKIHPPTKIERASCLKIPVQSTGGTAISYVDNAVDITSKYDTRLGCCWPIGDPKTADFRFCGEVREGRNYCAQHTKRAYERHDVLRLST